MTHQLESDALSGLQRLDDEWGQQSRGHGRSGVDDYAVAGSAPKQFVASIVLPGSAMLRRSPFAAAALLLLGVVAPIALALVVFARRDQLLDVALSQTFLLAAIAVLVFVVLTRFIAVGAVAYAHRRDRKIAVQATVAGVVVLALCSPALWVAAKTMEARSTLDEVFAEGSDEPLFEPIVDPVIEAGSGVTEDGQEIELPVPVDPESVTNILIFGGDAGPGRWGMRTDTMMLVTVHDASGRTALTSIPRNLTDLQFPPGSPLALEFPDGFDDLTNALFTHVNADPDLVEHYGQSGLQPEAIALVEALGYSLGAEIDDFALVNMQGFAQVIDALGGVTLELDRSVPLPPSIPGERPLPTSVGPGVVEMDGALAIAYARSRSADSDYQRMGRQRELLAALGSQVSAGDALGAFTTVSGVLDDSMRTSLSPGEFNDLLQQLGESSSIQESVGLAPPLIAPGNPDYGNIAAIVNAVQNAVITGTPSGYAR